MKRLNGKVAIVTGGAKGIGAATARRLHAEGAHVAIFDVDLSTQSSFAGTDVLFLRCDVTNVDAVEGAVRQVVDRFGEIEVLVNNAGIQHYGTVLTTPVEDWDHVMNVNLKSAFVCARSVIPSMQRRGRVHCCKRGQCAEFAFSTKCCALHNQQNGYAWV